MIGPPTPALRSLKTSIALGAVRPRAALLVADVAALQDAARVGGEQVAAELVAAVLGDHVDADAAGADLGRQRARLHDDLLVGALVRVLAGHAADRRCWTSCRGRRCSTRDRASATRGWTRLPSVPSPIRRRRAGPGRAPGTSSTATFGMRPTGMPSSSSWRSGRSDVPDRVSITGAPPRTVMASSTWPTASAGVDRGGERRRERDLFSRAASGNRRARRSPRIRPDAGRRRDSGRRRR